MINEMSRCKIFIPPMLMVMFFLCSLHSCYEPILDQFRLCYKSLETASLDSIVSDIRFDNKFKAVGADKKALRAECILHLHLVIVMQCCPVPVWSVHSPRA
jgi:hypothetical protein